MSETKDIQRAFVDYTKIVAEAYNYDALQRADFNIVDVELEPQDETFPMQLIDSRRLGFEFNQRRYQDFRQYFHEIFSDRRAGQNADSTALRLFIGAAIVRPVIQRDFFEKFPRNNSRHVQAIGNFYKKRDDINLVFSQIFHDMPEDRERLLSELTDESVMKINGNRVSFSFLHGALRRGRDRRLFVDLAQDSRNGLREMITRDLPTFRELGKYALGDGISETGIGDRWLVDILPSWLIALACPLKRESYDHLSSKIWQDSFHIDVNDYAPNVIGEDDTYSYDDEQSGLMPSTYDGEERRRQV